MIGKTLGSLYVLDQPVSTTEPASLFLARRNDTEESFLLWVLDSSVDATLRGAFLEVARRTRQVENERIPRVLDVGEDSGIAFVAVEKTDGTSLDQAVKGRGRMSVADAVGLAYQTLHGLQAVHAAGLAHGSIEPHKLVLQEDGLLKLTGVEVAGLGDVQSRNPTYTAPEVRAGHQPDTRSDLFSLGVVLYELLSGRLPFSEGDEAGGIPPLRYLRPDVPRELDELLDRTLGSDADRRPQSAEDMGKALEAAMQGKPYELAGPITIVTPEPEAVTAEKEAEASPPAPPVRQDRAEKAEAATRSSRKWPLAAALGAAVLIVAGLGWFSFSGNAALLGAAPAPAPTAVPAVPTPLPPTQAPPAVPATVVAPTAAPTVAPSATPQPAPTLLKTAQERDQVGRDWWVYSWSDGTTSRVEIVPAPVLSTLSAKTRGIRLFESGPRGLPTEQRQYATRLPKDTTRFLNYELDLAYPDPGRAVNFSLRAFYYDSADRLLMIQTQNAHVESGWTQSYHWNGYGWPEAGHWETGKYRIDLYDGTDKLTSISFEIY